MSRVVSNINWKRVSTRINVARFARVDTKWPIFEEFLVTVGGGEKFLEDAVNGTLKNFDTTCKISFNFDLCRDEFQAPLLRFTVYENQQNCLIWIFTPKNTFFSSSIVNFWYIWIFAQKIIKIVLLDSNVDFWRENSNISTKKINVARFAREIVKWDFF